MVVVGETGGGKCVIINTHLGAKPDQAWEENHPQHRQPQGPERRAQLYGVLDPDASVCSEDRYGGAWHREV